MKKKTGICIFLLLGFFFSDCQSITRAGAEFQMPAKTVILSFDDGPNANGDTTARLLDVLKKRNVRAMFALIGENCEAYPELARRIHEEGHIIINHGYSGKWANNMKDEQFKSNLIKGSLAINAAIGEELEVKLYRPHGGFYTKKQEEICLSEGFAIIPGNIRVYDAVSTAAEGDKIAGLVIKKAVKNGSGIILLHDSRDSHFLMEENLRKNPDGAYNRSFMPETAEKIIAELLERGFTIGEPELVIR
jgi:peptidoglycan/xylan/chitin deacetylase (PgdA/CDA1 family)